MKKLTLLLLCFVLAGVQLLQAQNVTIKGTVASKEDGAPIPGVSIVVKGTTIGTITDFDGKYSLNVPENTVSLIFSFVGMKTMEVPIEGRTSIDVTLESDVQDLNEVVITAYGIKRASRELGYATAKVDNEEITAAGATNVVNGLTGKVSGLQINTVNNGVNPDTRITLRGNRHFLASNQALVVLDGVPVSATFLNSINPNDIESVNVLKGASASALYGNDASNGVLIVSTKKGGKQKPTVKYSNTTTFERISYLPELQTKFGSGSGESLSNADNNYTMWIGPDRNTDPYTSYENQCYGPLYNGQMVILGGKLVDGSYQMVPYSAIKDQKKNFFQTGVTNQNDISFRGGDDKNSFYVSAQDVNTTGTIPDDKNRRTGFRIQGGKTYGIFNADVTMGYTQTNTNVSWGDMYQQRGVYWNVLNTPAHVPLTKYKDIVNNPFATVDGYFNAYYPNPYWQIAHSRQITKRNDLLGSMLLSVQAAPWLEFNNRTGVVYYNKNYNAYRDEAIYNAYSQSDPWSQGHMGTSSPYAGESTYSMETSIILTNDFLAIVKHDFGQLSAKVILGGSLYTNRNDYMSVGASALVIPELYNISNRIGEPVSSQRTLERRSLGAFVDGTFGFKNYAFLHVSGRNDWDSRLVKENRSFFYPGADLSLVLSDMIPALKDGQMISFLKLRGGVSKTGQVSLANWYGTVPSYVAATGFPYGSNVSFNLNTTLSNPKLRPEITKEIEAGFEIGFVSNRIHLEGNLFKSNTIDQTIPAAISSTTGFYKALINAGELETKGIETDLRFTPLLALGDVSWNMTLNYSYNMSKVISIFPGLDELFIQDAAGNFSASYAVKGEQFPLIKTTDVKRDPQGRMIVDAVTGLPKKDEAIKNQGHANPNHILGIVNTFNYKGFGLNIVAEYRSGNVISEMVGNALDFTGVSDHSTLNGRQPFVIPNSVIETSPGVYTPNTDVLVRDASRAFWVSSDYHTTDAAYVVSAAFWKLREVALSYDIPVKQIYGGKILQAAQISVVGRNLLMWRPKTNVWTDPEFNTSDPTSNAIGYTNEDQTPPTRILGFSVKLTF
jgi:TonB-linked SusC/RagA family outer membrane protein